jgi:hypothetical protein
METTTTTTTTTLIQNIHLTNGQTDIEENLVVENIFVEKIEPSAQSDLITTIKTHTEEILLTNFENEVIANSNDLTEDVNEIKIEEIKTTPPPVQEQTELITENAVIVNVAEEVVEDKTTTETTTTAEDIIGTPESTEPVVAESVTGSETTETASETVTETTTTTEKPSKKIKVKKEKKSKKNGDLQTDVSLVVVENGNGTLKSIKRKESVGAKIKRVFTLGKGDKKKALEQAASNGTTEIIPTSETNGDVATEKIEAIVSNVETTGEVTPSNGDFTIVDAIPVIPEEVTKQQELILTETCTPEQIAALNLASEKHKNQCIIV